MKKMSMLLLIVTMLALVGCESHDPLHSLYVGYVIEYGEPDKKESFAANSNLGVETWTWYDKGAHSIRAKVEFQWKKSGAPGLDWKVEQIYPEPSAANK